MRLGIMQPYFFPYLGYFDLINRVDRWVVFDTAQYIRHGWVNRNRILRPDSGWQYVVVPTERHHRQTPISGIRISRAGDWRARILGQLAHYRKQAPCFDATMALVAECLDPGEVSLARLNVRIIERVCRALAIPFRREVFSEMSLALGPVAGPGDWALRICEARGADEYVNPPGGTELFEADRFRAGGIKLTFQTPVEFVYPTGRYAFVPWLSIIDVLMWNEPAAVKAHLDALKNTARQGGEEHGLGPQRACDRTTNAPRHHPSAGSGQGNMKDIRQDEQDGQDEE